VYGDESLGVSSSVVAAAAAGCGSIILCVGGVGDYPEILSLTHSDDCAGINVILYPLSLERERLKQRITNLILTNDQFKSEWILNLATIQNGWTKSSLSLARNPAIYKEH
jgi:hypothetical protein